MVDRGGEPSHHARSLAAANGLSEPAQVVTGQIQIPSEYEASTALQGAAPRRRRPQAPTGGGGGYTVQLGDTLSAIARAAA